VSVTVSDAVLAHRVEAVRRFSRFYTRRIGVLHEGLLGSALTLTEGRIIYEVAQGETTASRLAAALELDSGYLSRVLRGLEERGLIERRPSATDARQNLLSLAPAGQAAFAGVDARSREEVGAMLKGLDPSAQRRLVAALEEAERLLGGEGSAPAPYLLRPHRPGDMGWIVHRQTVLYAEEYGWDGSYEALAAEIVAGFIRNFDPARERCWIAEREGAVVGSVFLMRASDELGKLRLLYVEPATRGLGVGRRLVEECIRSARELGYRRLTLWTNDVLVPARRLYAAAGFRCVKAEPHRSFGHDLVGETWEMDLTAPSR
jgi:DNA-binding MarR family transcriptional regulator/GNAT superfamily N-acetyltransferase